MDPRVDLDQVASILDRERKADRRRVLWAGIRGALGIGPRVLLRSPDERLETALSRIERAFREASS